MAKMFKIIYQILMVSESNFTALPKCIVHGKVCLGLSVFLYTFPKKNAVLYTSCTFCIQVKMIE